VIAECQNRLGRDPAILDWNAGPELATAFPRHTVFTPPITDSTLPYLDQSIDVVAVSASDQASLPEARRVAQVAVVVFSGTERGGEPRVALEVDWRSDGGAALPSASIVVPVYNNIAHTEACLSALRETLPRNFEGEVIVVDDASTDDTQARLKQQAKLDPRLKILRNRKNSGFVLTCNRGASSATGDIVIFLNNDTLPLPGWLQALLRTFRDYPDAGAVGSKLVYPDGRLQEAGAVVFSDGSGANFGKWDYETDDPLYNFVREVDYCSGAVLATRRSLLEEIGGLDEFFAPGYYEETDYCFSVREKGYRVYYQPESTVIHVEGATGGTDLSSGTKRYQVVNRAKFVKKWARALKGQPPNPNRFDSATWHALAVRDEWDGVEDR
jgi:GT2 family glycosyltransferase